MKVFGRGSTLGRAAPAATVFRGVLWLFAIDILFLAMKIAAPAVVHYIRSLARHPSKGTDPCRLP